MKKIVLLASIFLSASIGVNAQFYYSLFGNPVNTTGWVLNAPTTYTNADSVILNDTSVKNVSGYIYNATQTCLTRCAGWTAKFDFKINNHSPQGPGEGLAFWFLQNPPTASNPGTNVGLPSPSRGAAFIIDTHDDDGNSDNPVMSLRRITNNYNEGTGFPSRIGQQAVNQSYAIDGAWHHCEVTYNVGAWSVAIDGNPPIITGFRIIPDTCGYFGFSSSTHDTSYSKHAIRNVEIIGSGVAMPQISPVTISIDLCQDSSSGGTLTTQVSIPGDSLLWWDVPVGGTQLPGAPIIPLAKDTCYKYYVSQYLQLCDTVGPRNEVNVCVVQRPTPPGFTYEDTYCTGAPFTPIYPPAGQIYRWYPVPVGGVGDTTSPIISTGVPDTIIYYVSREFIGSGCESDRRTVPFYIIQSPEADFDSAILYGCIADTVTFTNKSRFADSAVWFFGDGTSVISNGPADSNWSPTHIYYSQQNFDVKLVLYNSNGCPDSITKKLNNQHPLVSMFTQNDDTVCQGFQVEFTDQSNFPLFGTTRFFWDYGDGTTDTIKDGFNIYERPGSYLVMHVITDFVPCSDTSYKIIVVDSAGVMGIILSDTSICEGDLITFMGEFTTIGLNSFRWEFGDGFIATNINPVSHTYDDAGVATVTLRGDYRACDDIDSTLIISVQPYPAVNLGPDTTLCPNGPGIVIGDHLNQNDPNATWLWSTGDSTSAITVRHPGIYTVRTTEFGCSTSDSVEIFKDCYIDIPNSFSPNNDGTNDFFLPRQLLSKSVQKFNMQIFNRWGQLVFQTERIDGRGWDGKFNGKDQPVGTYIYLIDVMLPGDTKEHYQGNVTLLR